LRTTSERFAAYVIILAAASRSDTRHSLHPCNRGHSWLSARTAA